MTTKPVEILGPEISNFDRWVPRDYLTEYFHGLQEDERHVIRYFCNEMRAAAPGPVLFFGCGPGMNHAFVSAPYLTELVLADYLRANLDEIEAWVRNRPGAYDWTDFVRYTLRCESGEDPTGEAIDARVAAIRAANINLVIADAGLTDPMGAAYRGYFASVLSPFCAESITADKAVWARYSRNIASLVRPGGLMLTAALRRSQHYRVGSRYFPSANIDEADLRAALAKDFHPDTIKVEVREVPQHREQGYSGIVLARAQKA
jgi:hypothetical protein